jgi:hypothetical protein
LTDLWEEDNAYRHRFGIDAVTDTETIELPFPNDRA